MTNGHFTLPALPRFTANTLSAFTIVVGDTLTEICRRSPETVTREWIVAHMEGAANGLPKNLHLAEEEMDTLLEMISLLSEVVQFGLDQ